MTAFFAVMASDAIAYCCILMRSWQGFLITIVALLPQICVGIDTQHGYLQLMSHPFSTMHHSTTRPQLPDSAVIYIEPLINPRTVHQAYFNPTSFVYDLPQEHYRTLPDARTLGHKIIIVKGIQQHEPHPPSQHVHYYPIQHGYEPHWVKIKKFEFIKEHDGHGFRKFVEYDYSRAADNERDQRIITKRSVQQTKNALYQPNKVKDKNEKKLNRHKRSFYRPYLPTYIPRPYFANTYPTLGMGLPYIPSVRSYPILRTYPNLGYSGIRYYNKLMPGLPYYHKRLFKREASTKSSETNNVEEQKSINKTKEQELSKNKTTKHTLTENSNDLNYSQLTPESNSVSKHPYLRYTGEVNHNPVHPSDHEDQYAPSVDKPYPIQRAYHSHHLEGYPYRPPYHGYPHHIYEKPPILHYPNYVVPHHPSYVVPHHPSYVVPHHPSYLAPHHPQLSPHHQTGTPEYGFPHARLAGHKFIYISSHRPLFGYHHFRTADEAPHTQNNMRQQALSYPVNTDHKEIALAQQTHHSTLMGQRQLISGEHIEGQKHSSSTNPTYDYSGLQTANSQYPTVPLNHPQLLKHIGPYPHQSVSVQHPNDYYTGHVARPDVHHLPPAHPHNSYPFQHTDTHMWPHVYYPPQHTVPIHTV